MLAVNHAVDVGNQHAGIRWYELRNPGPNAKIHQQGTHSPDATHRWMAAMNVDGAGNFALGYSLASASMFPSIAYVGRLATDPLGTMPLGERILLQGGGSQTGSHRWGDYVSMSIDPVDDCTFWFTNEYFSTTASTRMADVERSRSSRRSAFRKHRARTHRPSDSPNPDTSPHSSSDSHSPPHPHPDTYRLPDAAGLTASGVR